MSKELIYDYFGNTTLRVFSLASNIEKQLQLLDKLFKDNPSKEWDDSEDGLQHKYFLELVKNELMHSSETKFKKQAKNARQKTSPLADFELIDRNKKLITTKGKELLNLLGSDENIWKNKNNFLQIENISLFFLSSLFSYVKQDKRENLFQKYLEVIKSCNFELSDKQFSCLPLINNFEQQEFLTLISKIGNDKLSVEQLIILAMGEESVNQQLEKFRNDINLYGEIKDTAYFAGGKGDGWVPKIQLFLEYCEKAHLKEVNENDLDKIYKDKYIRQNFIKPMAGKIKLISSKKNEINEALKLYIAENFSLDFYKNFFIFIKIEKHKKNLYDYKDLNRRYLNLTDCFEFGENISLTENFKLLFSVSDSNYVKNLLKDFYNFSEDSLDSQFNHPPIKEQLVTLGIKDPLDLRERKKNNDIAKIKELMKTKFPREKLYKHLMPLFKNRTLDSDQVLIDSVSKEANVPTIFEYLIAIAWCYFDGTFDPIISANLSLDADMLPKSHAGGGQSDIPIDKGDHLAMLEVTLTNKKAQKKAESEPVTRHLGELLLSINDMKKRKKSFGVFIAADLDPNTLDDWRNSRERVYRSKDREDKVNGLPLMALDTDNIIEILRKELSYKDLLPRFWTAMNSDEKSDGLKWYEDEVKPIFNS